MTKGTYFATIAIVFAVAAGAMGASLASNGVEGSSSAKYPMLAMAKAVLREQARAIQTTSEVLTVNLTNMVILLVVKAIIFGFGFFGAGRRSANSPLPEIQFGQTDFMMMASYALGSTNSNYDCLYRTACEEPEAAHQYMTASKMLLKGVKMISK